MSSGTRGVRYDVAVIGSGLGGLSAAALLARAGRKVILIERQDGPGGYAHAFRRGEYLFDPAIHFTVEAEPNGFLDLMLDYLGVRGQCEFIRADHPYRVDFPDFSLVLPSGREEACAAIADRFPDDVDGVRAFFELRARFFAEASEIAMHLSLKELEGAVERFPTFFSYRGGTVADALDRVMSDARAKAVCAAIWPYIGLPPSEASFYMFSQFLTVITDRGSYYCRGSFQKLADAFVSAIQDNGGDVVFGAQADAITVDGGEVRGVVFDDRRIEAPVVISNADARVTLEGLVGVDHLPAPYLRRLQRMQPALSAFVLYGATTLDMRAMGAAHECFLYEHWDHDSSYRDALNGQPGGMWASVPTLVDPSLAPRGEHIVIMTTLAPYVVDGGWEEARERYQEAMLGKFEQLFPGLRAGLTFLESATPETLAGYTLNTDGATYGWALRPDQVGSKRLGHETPVKGLYLAGHWTNEGAGSFRVILSGLQTARLVLASQGEPRALPSFQPANLASTG